VATVLAANLVAIIQGGDMKRTPLKRKTPLKPSRKPMKRTPFAPLKSPRQMERIRKEMAFRRAVRKQYLDWVCHICGHTGERYEIQGMHLIPKGQFPCFKYVIENVRPGCVACHRRYDTDWRFRAAVDERLGWGIEKEKIRNGIYKSMF
jgi:hypothetical protein